MKRHSSAASLALAVLAVLGLAGPVAAGEQVPFKGRFEGDVTRGAVHFPFVDVLVEGTVKRLTSVSSRSPSRTRCTSRPGPGSEPITSWRPTATL